MSALISTVRESDANERRWFCGGGVHTWIATDSDTGGTFLLFEDDLDQGKVTPLHQHPHAEETFYMLEGEILLSLDGQQIPLGAGGRAIIPRGVPHAFLVTSPRARMLCLQTPGGGEAFYRLASSPAVDGQPQPPVDFDRVRQAAGDTDAIVLLGPPPFQVP
jgi:quercetin dioxygenase-like cupin family protein